jgi:ribosomal protein S18 acetylase RimI-like enzyme
VWLIHSDGQPAGYVALTFVHSLEFGGRCAFIDEFYVDRPFRGAGVGKEALRQVYEVEAPALGVRALFLEVSGKNAAACGLYRSAGFSRREYALMTKWLLKSDKQ